MTAVGMCIDRAIACIIARACGYVLQCAYGTAACAIVVTGHWVYVSNNVSSCGNKISYFSVFIFSSSRNYNTVPHDGIDANHMECEQSKAKRQHSSCTDSQPIKITKAAPSVRHLRVQQTDDLSQVTPLPSSESGAHLPL